VVFAEMCRLGLFWGKYAFDGLVKYYLTIILERTVQRKTANITLNNFLLFVPFIENSITLCQHLKFTICW
jgi:hypothetical protein